MLAILAGVSCGRRLAASRPPRLAVLRFENLGDDPAEDWLGRALEEIVSADLARARDVTALAAVRIHSVETVLGGRPVSDPGISAEFQDALAAGANRLGYGTYRVAGGRLSAELTIEDVNTRKMVRVLSTSAPAGDPIQAGAALARAISSQATAFPTRNEEALRDYVQAMEAPDLAQCVAMLQQSVAADPDYGPAYRMLAQRQVQGQDRAAAVATLTRALARGEALGAGERARIAAELAGLENQPVLRLRALAALVKLEPNDTGAWQALGAMALARRDFPQAVEAYRSLVEREPEDFNAWNAYGYAAAYQGDLNTAREAMGRYTALRPAEVNPLDSLGDVNLLCGRFHEAEEAYLKAAAKDPNLRNNGEFFKAAMARLWTGDVAGADKLAARYHEARAAAKDPLVEFRKLQWMWLTGRRKEACRGMEAFARASLNDVAPRAWTELVIWDLMLGDRAAAQAAAAEDARIAGAGSASASVTRLLVEPGAGGSEWIARVAQAFPNPQQAAIRNVALTTALMFSRQFQTAAEVLQRSVEAGPPEPDATAPVLLAWAYLETGRAAQAAPLLKSTPVPSLNGADALLSFSFPRLYYLRGEEALRQAKRDEARTDFRLFLQLSGPDPLMWGEEQKAKAALP